MGEYEMKYTVNELLEKMTLDEKIALLSGKNNWETLDLPQYDIPALFLADGPCGLRKQEGKGDHLGIEDSVPATATVSGGLLAATWNPQCAKENGRILGEEAAAENVDVLLAPAMNIVRSPLCGRNFEYFSEDPYLTGQIGAAYVEGVQEAGVGACPKHFAGNNQETEREYIDAVIDERTLREIYLPAFEEVVKRSRPQAVMAALNQVNGKYGAEQKHLLTDILREEWGFEGFTVSDWYGIVHQDQAVEAGLDLEMPYSCGVGASRIRKAYEEDRLTQEAIDSCCRRLLEAVVSCQKRKKSVRKKEKTEMYTEHHAQSRKIAEEGIVLLKNDDGILPLSEDEKVAFIGLYAKKPQITLDGSVRVIATRPEIPFEFIKEYGKDKVCWCQGYTESPKEDDSDLIQEAVLAAKSYEKVVFFMGEIPGTEKEGHDRKSLDLPKKQEQLLNQILAVNKNVIVVLTTPSAVVMPWNDRVKGIFECFLAGQGFGSAIANLLYGKKTPSGKLPVSFTRNLSDTSAYLYFPGDKKKVVYGEGVFIGYRYYDLKHTNLLYPFGHGLSYTTFRYKNCGIEPKIMEKDMDECTISMELENTGNFPGAEVVQLYVGMFDTDVKRPEKELKRFQKVYLEVGETKKISFTLSRCDFAYYDVDHQQWYTPEGEYQILIGASSKDIRLTEKVQVVSREKHRKRLSGWSTMGELKETSLGSHYYNEIMQLLMRYMPEDSLLFDKQNLKVEEKVDKMPLRFVNLLTNGILNNDKLLAWIDEVNA